MSTEIEAAVADAFGQAGQNHATHTRPPGSPCANCATPLQGPWCHACGQFGDDYHRSAWHLVLEAFEGFFHFDGRFWKTLPDLVLRPARLTRAYIEGHRAPQIPPLRLTLVVLLLVFVVGSLANGHGEHAETKPSGAAPEAKDHDDDDDDGDALRKAREAVAADGNASAAGKALAQAAIDRAAKAVEAARASAAESPGKDGTGKIPHVQLAFGGHEWVAAEHWIDARIASARAHPEEFKHNLENWAERFAFLMLPVSALILAVLFIFQRRFWLFDHLIFSMHSLSFQGLLLVAAMLCTVAGLPDETLAIPTLISPVHLFAHMRGVYGSSIPGTLIRMFLLAVASLVGAVLLIVGLAAVGIAFMEVT